MDNNTAKEKIQRIVNIVVHHAVSATMTGSKTFSLSFQLSQENLTALVMFMAKHGYDVEEAVKVIGKAKETQIESVRSIVSRTGKSYSPSESSSKSFLYWIFIGCLLVFGALAVTEVLPLWSLSLAALFCFGMIWLIWSPQGDDLNAIWHESAPVEDRLERMLAASEKNAFAYAFERNKTAFIALAVAAVLLITVPAGISVVDGIIGEMYHQAITAEGQPLRVDDSTGDKFVMYDTDSGRYFFDYLSDEYKAAATSEVAAVLKFNTSAKKVGTYGSVGDAYQYRVNISLYDCTTGETFDSTTVLGGDPPETLRVKSVSAIFGRDGYGSKPSDDDLKDACLSLIQRYQNAK